MFIFVLFRQNRNTPSRHQRTKSLEKENEELRNKVEQLTNRLIQKNLRFEFKFIENNDEKVFLHTGLPSKHIFDAVFELMNRFKFKYTMNWTSKIPKKTQFLMTLIKVENGP